MFSVPSRYIISACKHFKLSNLFIIGDDFRYKDEILGLLKDMNYLTNEDGKRREFVPHIILAWRLMIEWKIICDDETGKSPIMWPKNSAEDRKFWEM